jgi:hypothetical protein
MKNDIIIDTSRADNKTLEKLKKWVQSNPLNKAKKRIILKNNNCIICTNY